MEPETTGASACSMSSESKQHHSEYDHVGDGDLSKHRTGRTELEYGLPLSKSVLYTLQRAFYQSHSVDAWTKSIVPNYITTNQYIADQYALGFCGMQCHAVREVAVGDTFLPPCVCRYASVVIAYWDDLISSGSLAVGRLDTEAPLYLIEMGSASGRFAHFFVTVRCTGQARLHAFITRRNHDRR